MMQTPLDFSLDPPAGPSGLSVPPESITLIKAEGETLSLDPRHTHLRLIEERPPLANMEADWGAVCEVYRQKRDYYLSLRGVTLAPGDMLAVRYPNSAAAILFRVIDLEDGLARVTAPTFHHPIHP